MRILIVGGVAAGATAAVKARRTNESAEIILFEKGEYVSFANCGLPYYIGNVIKNRDELLLVTPELFRERFNIDVRIGHEVTDIDSVSKTVTVKTLESETSEHYDKLILATGGTPIKPDIPGAGLSGVHNVFTVTDVDSITAALATGHTRAVVVGGGFIGLETAENLLARGLETTLVERLPQVMGNMDADIAGVISRHLQDLGLILHLGTSIKEIRGKSEAEGVVLSDGTELFCDLVVLALGVRPDTHLAVKAGAQLGPTGGVCVDGSMRTSVPDIFAAGDMAESTHLISGKPVRLPLAGSANKQGRVAGACAAGDELCFKGVIGTSILKAGEFTAAKTGFSQHEAEQEGFKCKTLHIPGFSNAAYYPGAEALMIKLTAEIEAGRILGAQIIGKKGVDKRIDVFATAIYSNLTVFDLENLDLAYAPPFSSAKDPAIMSGMVFANMLRGTIGYVTTNELTQRLGDSDTVLLDVRTKMEYDAGAIEGSVLLPVDELRMRYGELDKSKTYILYCGVGYRAYNACLFLNSLGYKTLNLSGGYKAFTMNI